MRKERLSAKELLDISEHFESSQWQPLNQLLEEQWMNLGALLKWAEKNVPFHRARFKEAGIAPEAMSSLAEFRSIPTMRRQDLVDAEHNGLKIDSFACVSSQTTGTSGPSVVLWRDPLYDARLTFPLWRRWLRAAGLKPQDRYIRLVSVPVGPARTLGRAIDISMMTSTSDLLDNIESVRPNAILMPPATLEYLSLEMINQNRRPPEGLRLIVTNGDNLTLSGRELCKEAFGCDAVDHYASRECSSGMAWQCSAAQGYHVNVENVIVEILNHNGEPADPGEIGRVVITDLSSKPVPIIRYEIGDLAAWQENSCVCGRSLPCLSSIDGRVIERMKLASGEWLTCHVLNIAFGKVKSPIQYQVRENKNGLITIDVVVPPKVDPPRVLKSLRTELQKTVLSTVKWNLNPIDSIPGELFSKRRLLFPYNK